MAFATITLGNKAYNLGMTNDDILRRKLYFLNPEYGHKLSESESSILTALGFDDKMIDSMRPHMAQFLNSLPECQSSSSLYLKKDCEIPYYVMWSLRLADRATTKKRLDANREQHKSQTDIGVAETSAWIDAMKEVPDKNSKLIEAFSLIPVTAPRPPATHNAALLIKAFSLIEVA